MTVAELSERELIARVQQTLAPRPSWMVVGIGDDAAVLEPVRNQLEVLTTDAIVEGVHFDRRFTPPDAIGHRALAVNLSDLAAMGAEPRGVLLSFALPPSLDCNDFDAVVSGIAALAAGHHVHVAGGNLTRSPGPLMIDVTAMGSAKRRNVLRRSGARPGDEVYVTGTIGGARAGLEYLQSSLQDVASGFSRTDMDPAIRRYLYPEARVRTGILLGRNRAATACIDLSDGLADGLTRIAEAGGVGMTIEAATIPVEPAARRWFARHEGDPMACALSGGDDYELLFTASPRRRGRLRAVARHGQATLTRIGVCTENPALVLTGGADRSLPKGFTHFR